MPKRAPVGAAGLTGLTIVAACFLAFRVFLSSHGTAFLRQWSVPSIIIAYFLFCPAVACGLYSLLFESPKAMGLAGLAIGLLTVVVVRESVIILDGLLLLPFWFLATIGLVKFLRWRGMKIT